MRPHKVSARLVKWYLRKGLQFTDFYSPEDSDVFARVSRRVALVTKHGMILDLGCGSGIPTLHAVGRSHFGIGVDNDPKAIDVAARNAKLLKRSNVSFVQADFKDVVGTFALIMSNPPYIPSRSKRIDQALESFGDGTSFIKKIFSTFKNSTGHFVIHFASITNPLKILEYAYEQGFKLDYLELTLASFGRYTSHPKRLGYLLECREKGISFFHNIRERNGISQERYYQLLMTSHFRKQISGKSGHDKDMTPRKVLHVLAAFQEDGLNALSRVPSRVGTTKLRLSIYRQG